MTIITWAIAVFLLLLLFHGCGRLLQGPICTAIYDRQESRSVCVGGEGMTTPLWRRMQAAALKEPPSADGPGHRFAAMLRVVAAEIERRGAADLDRDPGETADWLIAEADRAEDGE